MKIKCDYDAKFDVLYIGIGNRDNSYGDDEENGILCIKDLDTDALTGITILGFQNKFAKNDLSKILKRIGIKYDDLRKFAS